MAEANAEVRAPPSWMYVNDVRILLMLLGVACVILGIGMLLFLATGSEHTDTIDVLLGTAIFLMMFCLLLFVPRLRSRGPSSYSMLVERPMDDVEAAILEAAKDAGQTAHVEVAAARLQRPPHLVFFEGVPWRFTVRAAAYRETKREGTHWTELVQSGFENSEDEVARDLRDRVLRRLATSDGKTD